MTLGELTQRLGISPIEGVRAADATQCCSDNPAYRLKPSEALLIVGWLEAGRYTAARRAIQLEISHHKCPACGEPERAETTECQRCGRVW